MPKADRGSTGLGRRDGACRGAFSLHQPPKNSMKLIDGFRLVVRTADGTVSTPDQDRVDDLGKAVGVERTPDPPFAPPPDYIAVRDKRRVHLPG